jgi:hypothetical protein
MILSFTVSTYLLSFHLFLPESYFRREKFEYFFSSSSFCFPREVFRFLSMCRITSVPLRSFLALYSVLRRPSQSLYSRVRFHPRFGNALHLVGNHEAEIETKPKWPMIEFTCSLYFSRKSFALERQLFRYLRFLGGIPIPESEKVFVFFFYRLRPLLSDLQALP